MISQTRVARKIQIQALTRAMSNWMSHQRRFVRRKNSNSKRWRASRMILIQRKRRRRACRRTVRRRTCLNLMKRTWIGMMTRKAKTKRIRRGSKNSLRASNSSKHRASSSSRHRASSNRTRIHRQHPGRRSYRRSKKGNKRHKKRLFGAMCVLNSSILEINWWNTLMQLGMRGQCENDWWMN